MALVPRPTSDLLIGHCSWVIAHCSLLIGILDDALALFRQGPPHPIHFMAILLKTSLSLLTCWAWLGASTVFHAAESATVSGSDIQRIREEGLERSEVMATASYLTDVIGERLTASPSLRRANEWTRDRMTSWGLANAHLHAWGPFGRGWTVKLFTAQVIEPICIPLTAYPRAWSPGLPETLTGEVVWFYPTNQAQLDAFKGRLKGAIVMTSETTEVKEPTEPLSTRLTDAELLEVANAGPGGRQIIAGSPWGRRRPRATNAPPAERIGPRRAPATPPRGTEALVQERQEKPDEPREPASPPVNTSRRLAFLAKEGPALLLGTSRMGDNGTLSMGSATVLGGGGGRGGRVWSTNPPAIPPQIVVSAEQYNRLARMIQAGEKVRMEVDLRVEFHSDDLMSYNTIAELPGTDLKDEIVMLGAHMDSWQGGTGATDNAAGVAAVMEAVRIIKAAGLQPRRTIRVGLWAGEEQGLLGSRAYVQDHFGSFTNVSITNTPAKNEDGQPGETTTREERRLAAKPDYDRFSAYFNLDNGAGRIRGIYLQSNEGVRPLFRRWLEPLRDLGAETLAGGNTGSTDHMEFDRVGLPGFQFIQDPLDYFTRTHHTSADVFDRIPPEDLKQASVVLAVFAYQAAMMDEKLPRKTANAPKRWP